MSLGGGQTAAPAMALAQETTINDDTYQDKTVYGNHGDELTIPAEIAIDNTITISTDGVVKILYGGHAAIRNASNNNVIIEGGRVEQDTWGGYAVTGNAIENHITVNGGTLNHTAVAGETEVADGVAHHNTITINNGSTKMIIGGRAQNGIAENNTVVVKNGSVLMPVGGYTKTGLVRNNTVAIYDGEVTNAAYGGMAETTGNVEDNIVNIYGGTIKDVAGGISLNGNATGNTVNIYGVTNITDSIQGGKTTGGTSADNTVNILGTISVDGILDGDTIQSLNVYSKSNSVGAITGSIDNMHFYLPAGTSAGDTMLTVTTDGTVTDISNTTIDWTPQAMLTMNVGEKVTLIRDDDGLSTTGTVLPGTKSYTYTTGISSDTTYNYITQAEENAIVITLNSKTNASGSTLPERTKSLTETSTAVTALLNGGSDFLTAHGMEEAEAVALDPEISVVYGRLVPFVAIGGGSLELDTGSSTDLKAFYANLGLTKEIKNRNGSLFVGPILEYGRGNYDSYLDNGVHGWGTGHYVGAGGFARQRNHDGLYYEGDLRFGRFSSDYRGDLASGLTADYDLGGSYIAGHLGLGKIYKVNPTDTVDAYIKYFYSRTSGDEVTVHSNLNNEVYNFNSVDSHRLRLGARYYHATNARSKIYAGLAYQYEFNGEAKATHDGLCTPAPSLKGSSCMAEIGWQVKPDKTNMTADVGLTGWTGKQTGITGRLKLSWAF